jgi:heme A synthase
MAHEIAHVAARHGTRQATRGAIINYASIPLIFMGGWTGYAIRQGAGLAIPDFPLSFGHLVPPMFSVPIAVNFAHRCGAVVVTAMVLWTGARTLRQYPEEPALSRPARGLLVLLAVQIGLGAATVLSRRAVIPTTSHVAVGAAVLATCLALTLRAWHLERAARAASVPEGAAASAAQLGSQAGYEAGA